MLRSLIFAGVVLALLIAIGWYGPRLLRTVSVPNDYLDTPGAEIGASYRVEPVTIEQLSRGDIVAWRTGTERQPTGFGRVVALPGEKFEPRGGLWVVNGTSVPWAKIPLADSPTAMCVPADTVVVWSAAHRLDSIAIGPVPAAMLHGRLGVFP